MVRTEPGCQCQQVPGGERAHDSTAQSATGPPYSAQGRPRAGRPRFVWWRRCCRSSVRLGPVTWINIIYGSLNNGYYGNGYYGGYGAYGGYNGLYGNGLYGYNGLYGGYGYNGLYGGYNYLGGYTYPTTYSTTGYVTSSPPLTYQQPNPTGAGVSVGVSWQLCTTPGGTGPIWVPLGHSTAGLLC